MLTPVTVEWEPSTVTFSLDVSVIKVQVFQYYDSFYPTHISILIGQHLPLLRNFYTVANLNHIKLSIKKSRSHGLKSHQLSKKKSRSHGLKSHQLSIKKSQSHGLLTAKNNKNIVIDLEEG